MPRRAPKQRSAARKVLHGIKKLNKRHRLVHKLKKYGPAVLGTAVTLGGIAAASYYKNPALAAAGSVAGGAIESHKLQGKRPAKKGDDWLPSPETVQAGQTIYEQVKAAQAAEAALERNASSHRTAPSPTGSRTSRRN